MRLWLLLVVCWVAKDLAGQQYYTYGFDTTRAYFPSDIIELPEGDLVVVGEVTGSRFSVENSFFEQYLVRLNRGGDTLWSSSVPHGAYGGSNVIARRGALEVWGRTGLANMCGMIGTWLPNDEYYRRSYSEQGALLRDSLINDDCFNYIYDFGKVPSGMIGLTRAEGILAEVYRIKHIDTNGVVTSVPLYGVGAVRQLQKSSDGYWLYNPLRDTLVRVDMSGAILRMSVVGVGRYADDFMGVEGDSLIFVKGYELTKMDSNANFSWRRAYGLSGVSLARHWDGSYILTGMRNGNLAVLGLSPQGDSLWSRDYVPVYNGGYYKSIVLADGSIATIAAQQQPLGAQTLHYQYLVIVDSVSVPVGTAAERVLGEEIVLYPNPAGAYCYLKGLTVGEVYDFVAVDGLGQVIDSHVFSGDTQRLDLANWPTGLYFYQLRDGLGRIVKSGKLVRY